MSNLYKYRLVYPLTKKSLSFGGEIRYFRNRFFRMCTRNILQFKINCVISVLVLILEFVWWINLSWGRSKLEISNFCALRQVSQKGQGKVKNYPASAKNHVP